MIWKLLLCVFWLFSLQSLEQCFFALTMKCLIWRLSWHLLAFCVCSVQSVMCEFEPPSTHHSQDNIKVPLQESLGLPFYRHSHLLPRPTPIYIILKEKDLISYSIICHINWEFFSIFQEWLKNTMVWMSSSYAAVQCKVDKEIFNYGHLVFQIRDLSWSGHTLSGSHHLLNHRRVEC